MFNRNFLKQLSFCVLGASSVSLVQNSLGFTDNNQSLITENETLQSSTGNKDSVDENLKLMKEQEENVETEPQEEKECKTLEESFVRRINSKEFKGFFGKIYLSLKLLDIIPAYLTLKVEELLKVYEWPEVLAFIGFIVVNCIFQPIFYVIVFSVYVSAFLGLFFELKYLGQKSKEGISKLIDIANINQNKGEDGAV